MNRRKRRERRVFRCSCFVFRFVDQLEADGGALSFGQFGSFQTQSPIYFPQQQKAGITADIASIKIAFTSRRFTLVNPNSF
jgi:hypothetical protein